MERITSELLAHADHLMLSAPGRVAVHRITDITEVRALRAAREALTEQEEQALIPLRLQMVERLDGSVSALGPKAKDKKSGLFGSLLGRASNFSSGTQANGGLAHMARQDAIKHRLPAPGELIDAAEAWAVSYLVAGRVDTDLEPLRRPWLEATITTE